MLENVNYDFKIELKLFIILRIYVCVYFNLRKMLCKCY